MTQQGDLVGATVVRLLAGLCERDHRARFSVPGAKGPTRAAFGKLLEITDDELVAEHPTASGSRLPVNVDDELCVSVLESAQGVFRFRVRVRELRRISDYPEGIAMLALAKPERIESVQRRRAHRVSPNESIPLTLVLDADTPEPRSVTGELINISKGGCAVIVDEMPAPRVGDECQIGIGIPPDPDALLLTGRVVRLLDLAETERTLLGIVWPAGHEPIEQQADARLTQFILSEQREALSHRTRGRIT